MDQKVMDLNLVRAHTQVVGSIPGGSTYEKAADHCFPLTSMFLSLSSSFPFTFSKSNEKKLSSGKAKQKKQERRKMIDSYISFLCETFLGMRYPCY